MIMVEKGTRGPELASSLSQIFQYIIAFYYMYWSLGIMGWCKFATQRLQAGTTTRKSARMYLYKLMYN